MHAMCVLAGQISTEDLQRAMEGLASGNRSSQQDPALNLTAVLNADDIIATGMYAAVCFGAPHAVPRLLRL